MKAIDLVTLYPDRREMESASDETVIEYVRGGNHQAYEVVMRRHNQRLFRTARSILKDNDAAQDAVQEAYISAYFKLDTYVPGGSFAAWLTRITVNEALMMKRKPDNRIADKLDNVDDDNLKALHANPADAFANKELAGLIELAIDNLPDNFRSVFVLRAVQQLSVQETADSLEIPEATVKTRFHRARNLMQVDLNQHMERAGVHAFEFAGQRCDDIVRSVFKRLETYQ